MVALAAISVAASVALFAAIDPAFYDTRERVVITGIGALVAFAVLYRAVSGFLGIPIDGRNGDRA
ncbi:hypothetical protein [Halovivax sp.]|uniref:hypothetical protein n=1 Tax=Halovivax sp. TaxID=1935978 RepID=UPI0025BD5DEA|nr:hypothetical protein [Halovivax sp.]